MPAPERTQVFISYSHRDAEWLKLLQTMLRPLIRNDTITVWDDTQIKAGSRWRADIQEALAAAKVAVLLVSPDFLGSDFIANHELPPLLKAAEEEGLTILWVAVRASLYKETEIADFQGTNDPARPLNSLEPRQVDDELVKIAEKIKDAATRPITSRKRKIPLPKQPFEPDMILIPAGEFLMGSDPQQDEHAHEIEQPQHRLSMPDYYLAKTPVTHAQYGVFMLDTGGEAPEGWDWVKHTPPVSKEDHPVFNVTWYDAVDYCQWLSEVTGKSYGLPSEAEWEKGARGIDGRIYPWGNQWDATRCNIAEGGKIVTTPADTYPQGASPYGVLDMAGNVWEWTRSLWGEYPYPTHQPEQGWRENIKAARTRHRVQRGGTGHGLLWDVRCAARRGDYPYNSSIIIGFRLVMHPAS